MLTISGSRFLRQSDSLRSFLEALQREQVQLKPQLEKDFALSSDGIPKGISGFDEKG